MLTLVHRGAIEITDRESRSRTGPAIRSVKDARTGLEVPEHDEKEQQNRVPTVTSVWASAPPGDELEAKMFSTTRRQPTRTRRGFEAPPDTLLIALPR